MIYSATHTTHFIYYRTYEKVTFTKRRKMLQPSHGILFLISKNGSFKCTIPQTGLCGPVFVTPVMEPWLEQETIQLIRQPITP